MGSEHSELVFRARTVLEHFNPRPAFSCLFGSVAREEAGPLSDIDVGVYFSEEVPLTVAARLSEDLAEATGRGVDVVELARLWDRKPALSYRIAGEMEPLTVDDRRALVQFRTWSFLSYFDTEPLRRMTEDSLRRRLRAGRAGDRDYVG